jgi:hypothetical protein
MGLDTLPTATVIAPKPPGRDQAIAPLPVPSTVPSPGPVTSPGASPAVAPVGAPGVGLGLRILGIIALVLEPGELGKGSDMPFPVYDYPDNPSRDGYAVVTHYQTGITGGHFSIQVFTGSATRSSHQAITDDDENTKILIPGFDLILYPSRSVRFNLPSAQAALIYQNAILNLPSGKYDPLTNSCMTHVCDVLRHGGLPVPPTFSEQRRWGIKLFSKLYR